MKPYAYCPLCGRVVRSEIHLKARIGDYPVSIGECKYCRLALQVPQPTCRESIDYMNSRWLSVDEEDKYITDTEGKKEKNRHRLSWLDSLDRPSNRLLDIGAGDGAFCAMARECGYEATGLDTSIEAVRRAATTFGVNLVHGGVDSIPEGPGFGVVTMWDVIEHLRDPIGMLKKVWARLSNDGIVVVETGNYECANRLLMKEKWGFYLYDHLWYFAPESLDILLHQAGFHDFRLHRLAGKASTDTRRLSSDSALVRIKLSALKTGMLIAYPSKIKARVSKWLVIQKARHLWPYHWDLKLLLASARK